MNVIPQLLIDCENPDLFFGREWFAAEEKLDGDRCIVAKNSRQVTGTSRTGQPMKLSDETVALAMLSAEPFVIDGEMMPGGEFVAFDILGYAHNSCLRWANSARAELLRAVSPFRCVERAIGTTAKVELFYRIREKGGEGVVFKALNATYEGGRSENYQRHKLYETDNFVVTGIDWGKCSVFVSLNGVPAGKVQSSFQRLPKVGDVVRVKYERRTENGKLLRARILSTLPV